MDRYADLIERMYEQYNISRIFPVPLLSIATALGYEVQYFEINTTTEDLSAVTFYNKKQIFISPNESGGRFRFALAHELGHIMLGHGNERESEFDTRENMWNPNKRSREYEADEFAAELLMPEEKFKEVWNATTDISIVKMYFNVSKTAVQKRIEKLEIKYE